jgi:predicted amino acid-binding ACT domain protein
MNPCTGQEHQKKGRTLVIFPMTECNLPLTAVGYDGVVFVALVVERLSDRGVEVLDIETRRKKQQAMMVRLVERKVRNRAQQIYETRGQAEEQDALRKDLQSQDLQDQELQDWIQAESEVLENNIVAPLYRRMRGIQQDAQETDSSLALQDSSACESPA